ncbi:hypothetical protein SBY92_000601 [Candida maltosa Xu316]|uniref:Subtelomeric hrmA-associated cluster protein AFUB-079030/YDR124W-like helical bundle domain-containing protein n=1 Tax=Candida maltosa (strain Xu316) TaxID=1245528 RepID=M3HP43_CANMX|nr:hypothetical protein G210_0062 [Candida maltosa Xu316]
MDEKHNELEDLVTRLFQLSEAKLFKFILITQGISPITDFQIHSSSHFTDSQKDDIRLVLGRSLTNIKPVLKHTKKLTLQKPPTSTTTSPVYLQLRDLFNSLNQNVCKEVAKSWIKLLQPDKQKRYPYTNKEILPPWWPHGVIHTEPDHLKKEDRIKVLINVARDKRFRIQDINANSLRHKVNHTEAIIHEICYICFIERMFYREQGEDGRLFDLFTVQDKEVLGGGEIELVVSDFRFDGGDGILQSRITMDDLNHDVMQLKSKASLERPKLKRQKGIQKPREVKRKISKVVLKSMLGLDQRADASSSVAVTHGEEEENNISLMMHDSGESSHSSTEFPPHIDDRDPQISRQNSSFHHHDFPPAMFNHDDDSYLHDRFLYFNYHDDENQQSDSEYK